jgi:hypothetical protein
MNTSTLTSSIAGAALIAVLLLIPGRSWIALGYHAVSYPVTGAGEAANVVIDGSIAYASLADRGVEMIDVASGKILGIVPPPPGSESVDDVAVADHFLFVLDARTPGHLSVFSLADPANPKLVPSPVDVAVGPFSGVSAANGRVIVSGGTSLMSLRSYDPRGKLSEVLATMDCGRGQPDVLLSPDGQRAFVSTHDWGPYFGLTTVRVGRSLAKAGSLPLDTYGFTAGGAKPASFPLRAALDDDVLLIADLRGLNVISIANLDEPRRLATLDVGVKAVNVDVRDHLAAVVGSSPKPLLVLVDVAIPSSPRVVRSIPLPEGSYPTGVAIGADHIAVASHRHGVLSFPINK